MATLWASTGKMHDQLVSLLGRKVADKKEGTAMNDSQVKCLEAGDVLFLERPLTAIRWPTGYFVLHRLTPGVALLSLVNQDEQGLHGTDEIFTISVEDLVAFSQTEEKARMVGRG